MWAPALVLMLLVIAPLSNAEQAGTTLPLLNPDPPHKAGLAAYGAGDYPAAIASLKQAVGADPADKEAVQLLGLSYYFTGQPKLAIPYLEKVQAWYSTANVDA